MGGGHVVSGVAGGTGVLSELGCGVTGLARDFALTRLPMVEGESMLFEFGRAPSDIGMATLTFETK